MQASSYWEIAAGYVGAMRAEIPFTSLYSQAVSLTLDETLITIRPRSTPLQDAMHGSADSGPGVPAGTFSVLSNPSNHREMKSYNSMGVAMLSFLQQAKAIVSAPDAL